MEKDAKESPEEVLEATLVITKEGGEKLLDRLQNITGYIEEDLHEQIINALSEWINESYSELLRFYLSALQKGLVPSDQYIQAIAANKVLKQKIVEISDTKGKEEPLEQKNEKASPFKALTDMKIPELKKIAGSLGLVVCSGMSRKLLRDMIQEETKKREKIK